MDWKQGCHFSVKDVFKSKKNILACSFSSQISIPKCVSVLNGIIVYRKLIASHDFAPVTSRQLKELSVNKLSTDTMSLSEQRHRGSTHTYKMKHMHTNKPSAASAGSYTLLNIVLVPKSESIQGRRETSSWGWRTV